MRRSGGKSAKEWEEDEEYQTNLASFKRWWEPYSTDERTGASIGGQPDAWRWWARPPVEEGKTQWERKQYGEIAKRAFKSAVYHGCWLQWKQNYGKHGQWVQYLGEDGKGRPQFATHDDPFISNCLPIEEQGAKMGEIWKTIGEKQYVT